MGYVVPKLEPALEYWIQVMGVGPFFLERHVLPSGFVYRGQPIRIDCKVALAFSGETYVELIEDLSPDETANTVFLRDMPGGTVHAAGGLQHVGCMVDSVAALLADPQIARNVAMTASVGQINLAYLQPTDGAQPGTMIELIERGPSIAAKIAAIKAASVDWDGAHPIRTLELPSGS
jgi:hypothetical protein